MASSAVVLFICSLFRQQKRSLTLQREYYGRLVRLDLVAHYAYHRGEDVSEILTFVCNLSSASHY